MRDYLKKHIREALEAIAEKHKESLGELEFSIEPPPRPELGDYSTNAAFLFAKKHGESPMRIAGEMRIFMLSAGGAKNLFEKITIAGGGFLNFKLSPDFIRMQFALLPSSLIRANKRMVPAPKNQGAVLVEYSSPNIGKPLSIAHIRSTIIGDALARIFRHLGYKVITDNHLGDWGLQAGILIAAYKLWGKKPIAKTTMQELLGLYVKFNAEIKEHDELAARARLETVMLQQEDRSTFAIWNAILKKSIAEFNRLYNILGVKFDYTLGESAYRKDFPKVVSDAQKSGIAARSMGAIVISLEHDEPPLIIQKQDGGYLYATFDLATIRYRIKRWNPPLMLYVISNEQAQYLDQTFRAAEKLGWLKHGQAVHIKFGLIRGEDMKRLSTRKGKTILLENVTEEAARKAKKIVEEKNRGLPKREKGKIAKLVGIGALKYNDLSQNRNTDIIFDWDKILDLQGNSAPYIQYTYARLRSIARKARNLKSSAKGGSPPEADAPREHASGGETRNKSKILNSLKQPEEMALMKKTMQLEEAVEDAAKEYLPNLVANYLWELANLANTFYEKCPVLKAEPAVRQARLAVISKTAETIKTGLSLLGIDAPERV